LVDHREFQCDICYEIFSKEIALNKHKEGDCTEVFMCKQCLQCLPKVEKLDNHWCRKAAIARCSQCLERFPSQDQRLRHERSGCTYTPSPEFRIVDHILYEEIKKSLEKKHWTFANEQDNNKKTWINNNISKFSGELSHRQRELIKWIALWECFPFAKSIPDSPCMCSYLAAIVLLT
jgi:C2H2-type zinc finger